MGGDPMVCSSCLEDVRLCGCHIQHMHHEAADRIAELEAEVKMWRNEDKKKQTACEQMGNRIAELEAALKDMAKYIWRDDYQKLEPTTRAALGDKK